MKTFTEQLELSTAMRDAVDELYRVFDSHSAPKHPLDVCTHCCMDAELEVEMRHLPLRQLTATHFYKYNASAKSAEQPADEIKYVLPRLLELLALGAELHHSTALQLQRLGNCAAENFSTKEREALDAYALCYFGEFLSQHDWQGVSNHSRDEVFDVLLMFDCGGVALQPLLEFWLKDGSTSATLHYISAGFYDFWKDQCVHNAFATDRARFQEVLKTWLTDESHRRTFANRISKLDMNAIDQSAICYYGSRITPKEMAETVFDLITY